MQKRVRLLSALLLGLAACGDEPPPLDLHEEELAVVFLGVETDVEGLSCAGVTSCTVPDFARLEIRFTGAAENGSVTGFQWRVLRPNRDPEPWQPFGSASLFLSADKDTAAVSSLGDTLWTLRNAVVTVRLPAADPDSASSAGTLAIEARVQSSSGGVSPADAGRREIQVVEPGPPQVLFVDVQNDRRQLQPCSSTGPCSVPYSAKLKVRVTGSADFAHITGFQWQIRRPHREPEPYQPFGSDSLFLPAERDTQAVDDKGLPLWALVGDTLAVYFNAARYDTFSNLGTLVFAARVRDSRREVSRLEGGLRGIELTLPSYPTVEFLDVTPEREDLPPCIAAQPCTIPAFTDFRVRFHARSEQNWIRGYTWSINGDLWEPFHSLVDTLFLPIGRDTVAVGGAGGTLWSLAGDVVTVHVRNDRENPQLN